MSIYRISYTSTRLAGGETKEAVIIAPDGGAAFAKIVALDSTAVSPTIQLITDNELT